MSESIQGIIENLEKINQNSSSEGCLNKVIEMFKNVKEEMEVIENVPK